MSNQYDKYLKEHIQSVRKAAQWMLENLSIANDLDISEVNEIKINVYDHDASKYSSEEYDAYDAYFYGEKDENAFNLAWLHHIHRNPHHWQHWLLMNDDGKYRDPDKVIALEMPKIYAFEMVADWWSFSWRSGNLEEVFDWYEEHKDNIILHPKTREFVESVLDEIRERLVDDLKYENTKLRKQVVQLQTDWESERDYANQMETKEKRAVSENEKLRKVCTDACRAICKMYVYIDGEWNYGDAYADPTYGPILRHMRELGLGGA